MGLLQEHQKYLNEFGFVSPVQPPNVDQNGVRWTAQYLLCLAITNQLTEEEKKRIKELFLSCEKKPGLLMRTPLNQGGQESWDNNVSYICVSRILDSNFPKRFIQYGQDHFWFYLTDQFSFKNLLSAFYLRFPHLLASACFAMDQLPGLPFRLYWALNVILASYLRSQDGLVLTALQTYNYKRSKASSWFCDFATKVFNRRFNSIYGGVGKVLANYWQNPNHPTVKGLIHFYG